MQLSRLLTGKCIPLKWNVRTAVARADYLRKANNQMRAITTRTKIDKNWTCISKPYALLFKQYIKTTIKVPKMADSITEGSIEAIHKKKGDQIKIDEIIAVIETDKTAVEVMSPVAGVLMEILHDTGSTVSVGDPLFVVDSDGASATEKNTSAASEKDEQKKDNISKSNAETRHEAAPKKSNTTKVEQKGGSITKENIKAKNESIPKTSPAKSVDATIQGTKDREERIVPMSRLRLRIAQRLKQAQNTAACLTTLNECDMSHIMAFRSDMNKTIEAKHGIKIGFVSAFVFAVAQSMMEMPQINGYISEDGKNIIYKNYVDISVAVATPTGLLVPVLRDCHRKTLIELEKELGAIAQKARGGKLPIEDMIGGTIAISNGGVFGSLFGTPILNPPQASILGLHSIKERPVVVDHEIVIRPMMYLALTYDHRMLDGREAVLFLNAIKNKIEDPRRFLTV